MNGMKQKMSEDIQSCALWFTQVEMWPGHTDLDLVYVKLHKLFSDQKRLEHLFNLRNTTLREKQKDFHVSSECFGSVK